MGSLIFLFEVFSSSCVLPYRAMKIVLLLLAVLVVCLDCHPDNRHKKKLCRKPKGQLGEIYYKDCKAYECIRKKKKYIWSFSFDSVNCCSLSNTGFPLGSTMLSNQTSDSCVVSSVMCADVGGFPGPTINIENVCPVTTTNATTTTTNNHLQCAQPYTTLNDTWRKVNYQPGGASQCNWNCDKPLTAGWYRFMEPAGTQLPVIPTPRSSGKCEVCQTQLAAWVQTGRNPVYGEGVIPIKICFEYAGNTCQWSVTGAKAVACKDTKGVIYILYYLLQAPACNAAYCALSV